MVDRVWDFSNAGTAAAFQRSVEERLAKFKGAFAEEAESRVKDRTPVDTGTLQNSIKFEVKQDSIEMYAVDYWKWVEFGTDSTAPKGMVRTTLNEAEQIAKVAKDKAGL